MSKTASDTQLTHEIRLNGARLLAGDPTSVAVIFYNLTGRNFAPPQPIWQTQTHAEYLAFMSHSLGAVFEGTIEMAEVDGPAIESHQFTPGSFRIRNFGNDKDCADIGALKLALRAYVGKSVTVEDLRAGGKIHYLDINESSINESYGSRLVVRDLDLLLQVPGHPVYA